MPIEDYSHMVMGYEDIEMEISVVAVVVMMSLKSPLQHGERSI
jgi:hypothetical protein